MSRVSVRFWIALLLFLNAVTLAWQMNAFARWGLGPGSAREPERLAQQIRPDAIRIETPAAAAERIAAEALEGAEVDNAEPAQETQPSASTGEAVGTAKAVTPTSAAPTPAFPIASANAPPTASPTPPSSAPSTASPTASRSAPSPAPASAVPAGRARVAPPSETPGVGPRATP
jgi:hypothetical protein